MIAMGLQQSIAFAVIGSPLAIVTPVTTMPTLPGLPRVSLVGLIIGVGGHLVALPLGFSGPLTGGVGTASLRLDTGIGHKAAPTMGPSTLAGHGFLLYEAVDLQIGLVQEAYESQPKDKRKERQDRAMRRREKNHHRADGGPGSLVNIFTG